MPVRRMKYSEFKNEELDRSAQFGSDINSQQPTYRYSQSYAGKTVLPSLNDIATARPQNDWSPPRSQPRRTPDAETASIDSWVTENESPRPSGSSPDSATSRSTLIALPSAGTQRSDEIERSLSPYTPSGADPDARPTTASSARYSSAAEEHSAEVARFVNIKKDGRSPTPVPPIDADMSRELQDSSRPKAPGHLYSDEEVNRPVSPESVITSASFERGDDGALQGGDHVSLDYSEEGETPTPAKTEQARPLGAQQTGGPIISLTPASAIDTSVERNVSLLTKHTKSSSSSNSTGQRLREVPSISSIGQSRSPSPQSDSGKAAPSPPKIAPVSPLRPGFGPRGASPNDPTSGRPMSFVALPRGPEGAPLQERIDIAKDHSESKPLDQRRSMQLDGARPDQRLSQPPNGLGSQLPSTGSMTPPALRAPSAPFASTQDPNASTNMSTNGQQANRSVSPAPRLPPARNSMDSPAQGPPRAHKRLSLTPSALRNEMPITPPERSPMAPLQKPVLIAPVTNEPEPVRRKKRESAFKILDVFKHRSSNSESGLPMFGRTTPDPDANGEDRSTRRQSIEIRGPPQVPRQSRPPPAQGPIESTAGSARQSLDLRIPIQAGPAPRQTSAPISSDIMRKPINPGERPMAARLPSNPPPETKPAHQRQTAEIRGLQAPSARSTSGSANNEPMRPYKSMRDYTSDTKAVISTFGALANVSRASTPVSRHDHSPSDVPSPVASISRYDARSSSPTMVRSPPPRSMPEETRSEPVQTQSMRQPGIPQTIPEQYQPTRVIQGHTPVFAETPSMQPAPLTIVKDLPQPQVLTGVATSGAPRTQDAPRQLHEAPAANHPSRIEPQQQVRPLDPKQVTEHVKRAAALAPQEPSNLQQTSLSALKDMVASRSMPPAAAQVNPASSRPTNVEQVPGSVPAPTAVAGVPQHEARSTAQQPPQPPQNLQSKRNSMFAPVNTIANTSSPAARPPNHAIQQGMLQPGGPPADAQSVSSIAASSQRESTTETTPEKTRKKRFSALGGLLNKANAAVSDLKHMIKDDKATQGLSYDRTQPDRPPSSIRIHAVPQNPDQADWDARNRVHSSSPVPPANGPLGTRPTAASMTQSPSMPQPQWTAGSAHGNSSVQSTTNSQQPKPGPLPQTVTAAAKSRSDVAGRDAPTSTVRPPPALERFSTQSSVDSAQLSPMVSAEQRRRSSSNSENTVVSPVSVRRDSSPERPQNRRASRSGHTGGVMPSLREQHQEQPYQINVPQASQVEADVEQREIWEAAQARGRWLKRDASEHGVGESPPQLPNVAPISPLVMPARPVATPRISSQSLVPASRQVLSDTNSIRPVPPPTNMQQSAFTQPQDRMQGPSSQLPPVNIQPSATVSATRQAPIVTPRTPTSNQSQMPAPVIRMTPPTSNGPINPELTVRLPTEAALQMVLRKYPPPASPEKQMEQHRIQHLAEYRTQEDAATAGADAATSGLSPVQRAPVAIAQPQPRRASREMQILADVPEATVHSQEENKEMGVSAAADAHTAALDKVRQARALVQARRQSEIPAGAVEALASPSSNEILDPAPTATATTTTTTAMTTTSLHTTTSITKTPIDKLGFTAPPPPIPAHPPTGSPLQQQAPTSPRPQPAILDQSPLLPTQQTPAPPTSSPSLSAPNTTLTSPILPEVVRFNSVSTDPRRIPKELHRSPSRDAPELRTQLTQEEEDWLYAQRLQRDEEKGGAGRVEEVEPVVMKATSGPMDDWSLW